MDTKTRLKQKVLIKKLLQKSNQNLNDTVANEVIANWLKNKPDLEDDYTFHYDGVTYDTSGHLNSGMITLFMQLIRKCEAIRNVTITFENGSVMNFDHIY